MTNLNHNIPPSLLSEQDPKPFTWLHHDLDVPVLIICDHASNAVPQVLSSLGLAENDLSDHIAWDIGAADLSRQLADELGWPALLAGFSRLVIDCNRYLSDPQSIPEHSDGNWIPGNAGLNTDEREQRRQAIFWPYHGAITDHLADLQTRHRSPVVISVHSFTPALNGGPRPWEIGVLWNHDHRLARPMLDALSAYPDITVGDNVPYTGRHPCNFSMNYHGEDAHLPLLMLEVRNDLLSEPKSRARWCDILATTLTSVVNEFVLQ
ncbi:MAG: N-formylglutamate amidohydrolase [Gammaproteobacteria bacterium]|nr:N-formylglutamate amidohydrolase [Gammaproteobacteria bacterium]